jgi:thiamine transport system permease protein
VKPGLRYLLALPPLAFLTVFYFYPLGSIFWMSFLPEGVVNLSRLAKLVSTSYYARVLWFTAWQAGLSTLITLVIALPGAYVFARFEFKGKAWVQSLTMVPFVLPTVVTAAAFRALLGPKGLLNTLFNHMFTPEQPLIQIDQTVWFFLMAHVFYNYTVMLRIVGGFWSRLPENITDAAKMLGASGSRTFFRITLPLLAPAILAASLLVFVFCFTSFGVVLLLGGPGLATLEVEIYRQALHLFNLPMASALSIIQILFTFGLMAVYTWFERKSAVSLMPNGPSVGGRPVRFVKEKILVAGNLVFLALLLGTPPAALLFRSLWTEKGLSFLYYFSLLENPSQSILYVAPVIAMVNSLVYAGGAMLIALALGSFSAGFLVNRRGKAAGLLDPIFMLPLSTSAVTLGFGFIIALDKPPLNLRASLLLPAIAHALVAFPFVIRSVLPAWRSIPHRLREAAALLGASPMRTWLTVDWPILKRSLVTGAVFAFAISMGEFGATVFVVRPQVPTLPLAIFRYLSHPGEMNYGRAMAMSCLLMITTAAGFMLLEKINSRRGGL